MSLPSYARLLFGVLEPASNLVGAVAGLARPRWFATEGLWPTSPPPAASGAGELVDHMARMYAIPLIPLIGTFLALFSTDRPPAEQAALAPARRLVIQVLLFGDLVHVANWFYPARNGGTINRAGFAGNVVFTGVLMVGRVAYLAGY
ncbi:hypothetical protein DFJ74DRAFT_705960 [Hyaloraphidium curvatum]|nr:hypothetical protein DFJ74DRAFT_705960 [Hyaloraphidium curvatum]